MRRGRDAGTTREIEQVAEPLTAAQLIDGGAIDRAGDGRLAGQRRDVQHVLRQQTQAVVVPAVQQKVVKVETGNPLARSPELDRAQVAGLVRSARLEQHVDERRQGTDRVTAWRPREARHVDPDGAQLPEADAEFEAAKRARDRRAQMLAQIGEAQAGERYFTDFRYRDRPTPIDRRAEVDVDGSPGANIDLVARSQNEIFRNARLLDRFEAAAVTAEELCAERGQRAPERLPNEQRERTHIGVRFRLEGRAGRFRLLAVAGFARIEPQRRIDRHRSQAPGDRCGFPRCAERQIGIDRCRTQRGKHVGSSVCSRCRRCQGQRYQDCPSQTVFGTPSRHDSDPLRFQFAQFALINGWIL